MMYPKSWASRKGAGLYDVIIVGGSFAGLATAMQLRGFHVLVIDQYPIGARQMSACGTPLATARAVGAEESVQEAHSDLVMHTGGQTVRFPLRDPYVTFDYAAFCRAMLAQTDAEVWEARATGFRDGVVATSRGPARARFVVDAAGWRSLSGHGLQPARPMSAVGYGVETELPGRPASGPGLHFFWEKRIVRNGYAWVFPCGATTRYGVCSFDKGTRLGPELARFIARWGLEAGATHGGVLAIQRREAVAGELFVVGDAAGRCLPVTGEGIRTAIVDGFACGRAIAAALHGAIAADEARARYQEHARRTARFHRYLLRMQAAIARTPDGLIALAGRACARPALIDRILHTYLARSGSVM